MAYPISVTAQAARTTRCEACGSRLRLIGLHRRPSILDIMTLVAATALACVIIRPLRAGPLLRTPDWSRYLAMAARLLVAWTPAVLVLQLRNPDRRSVD